MKEYAESTHEKTASAKIYTGRCHLCGVQLITDGTNNCKLEIFDNTAEGTADDKIYECTLEGTASVHGMRDTWVFPVSCLVGMYAKLTGTNASYVIEFHP